MTRIFLRIFKSKFQKSFEECEEEFSLPVSSPYEKTTVSHVGSGRWNCRNSSRHSREYRHRRTASQRSDSSAGGCRPAAGSHRTTGMSASAGHRALPSGALQTASRASTRSLRPTSRSSASQRSPRTSPLRLIRSRFNITRAESMHSPTHRDASPGFRAEEFRRDVFLPSGNGNQLPPLGYVYLRRYFATASPRECTCNFE